MSSLFQWILQHRIWETGQTIPMEKSQKMHQITNKYTHFQQVIKVLDLIDICVKKFLSPNMTLLVESRQDSTLNEIGALMRTYLQHDDWEVKDSALNLLYSCIDVAYISKSNSSNTQLKHVKYVSHSS